MLHPRLVFAALVACSSLAQADTPAGPAHHDAPASQKVSRAPTPKAKSQSKPAPQPPSPDPPDRTHKKYQGNLSLP
jgi:hypothetical protein